MPTAAAKQIHRLSDFVIEEVSMVDRAANKRKFLLFKRDDEEHDMPTTAIKPDGNGTFKTTEGDDKTKTPDKATKGIDAVEQVFFKVGDAVDRLMRVASVTLQADSLKLADGPTAKTVTAEIEAVKQVLDEVRDEINDVRKAITNEVKAAAAATEKAQPQPDSEPDPLAALEEFSVMLRKRGASMSQSRLKRFTSALTELASILREVGGDTKSLTGKAGGKDKTKKDVEAKPTPAPAPEPEPTAKADDGELAKLRKQLADTQREVAMLKRAPGAPMSITVEGDGVQAFKDADFSWPSDMNQPLGPDDVPAEHSFYSGR